MASSCPALPASGDRSPARQTLFARASRLRERAIAAAGRLSLHQKFWLSFAFVIILMTACALFAVHEAVQVRAERQIHSDARASLLTFQVLAQQQQVALNRKADLLATLAVLRDGDISALQDVGDDPWQSEDYDLLALTDSHGRVTALRSRAAQPFSSDATAALASFALSASSAQNKKATPFWWTSGQRLYQLAIQPYYQDTQTTRMPAGTVIVGREFG